MNSFFDLDWSAKCEWENLAMFSSKATESSTKLPPMDWGIEEEVEINAGSFNLSGWGGGRGRFGSDLQHGSSAKSSISASTDSSSKEGLRTSNFSYEAFEGFLGDFSKKTSATIELTGSSSPVETSVGSVEPLIGLKLGKRTYFEENCGADNIKTPSLSTIPVSSATTTKKIKSSCCNTPMAHCQVEGCNLDLSSAKDYHRKHKVCEGHSKSPKVIVGGLERRFCQQCSRFHSLSEFDAKKQSCRRRLSDHNARRRKPQQEIIQFNPTRLSSSFYDGMQQMNFRTNNSPPFQSRPSGSLTWEMSGSKFTLTKSYASEQAGIIDGRPHLPGIQLQNASNKHNDDSIRLVPSMSKIVDASNKDAALDYRRALSLLSTNSSSSCEPESITFDNPLRVAHTNKPSHLVDFVPQGLPLASSEYWQTGQRQLIDNMPITLVGIQENKHLKSPYATEFNDNPSRTNY